jgi:hypothetical protein
VPNHHLTLTAIKSHKSAKLDRLRYTRLDGSNDEIDMPRQGILPHDLVHAIVEEGFGLKGGFLTLIADGLSPQFMLSKELPKNHATGVAESVVEAMQTQLAQGYFDYESFYYGTEMACASRDIFDIPTLDPVKALTIFNRGLTLNQQWQPLSETQSLTLEIHW